MGMNKTLAMIAPYMVVNKATAIAGPIEAGSLILPSMITSPTNVPIIPIAGARSIQAFTQPCMSPWRTFIASSSASICPTSLASSAPSTSNCMPFAKNLSGVSWPSSAIIPSLRAIAANSTILSIMSSIFFTGGKKHLPMAPKCPKKVGRVAWYMTAKNVPPITIKIEAVSTNGPRDPPANMAPMIIPQAPISPTREAMSIVQIP